MCTDANGNVYITGTFQGSTITIGGYTLHNSSAGSLDVFVVKYDASGNVLWVRSGGGTNNDYANAICTDRRGNTYVAGYFRSPFIMFGTNTLTNSDSLGGGDIFIAKYDSVGNMLWIEGAGNAGGEESSYSICSDTNNNVYITGGFGYGNSTLTIFGNDTLTNRGKFDIFLAKYDSDGNVLWAKGMGGTNADAGLGVCTDLSGGVYITGYFQNSATLGSDTIKGEGIYDIFIAKYDSIGNELWAKSAKGIDYYDGFNRSTAIATDTFVHGKDLQRFTRVKHSEYVKYGKWLAEPREERFFEGERVYSRKILGKNGLMITVEDINTVADQQVYITKPKSKDISAKYLAGVPGSKLIGFFIRNYFDEVNDAFPQIKVSQLKSLPIKIAKTSTDKSYYDQITHLVSSLLQLNKDLQQTHLPEKREQLQDRIVHNENKIDHLVYELYGLSKEEIEIIESSTNPSLRAGAKKEDIQ